MTTPLEDEVRAWIDQDPDPDTRAELEDLLAAGDEAGLAVRFGGRLEFGTAGLRGPLGAGPTRMNRVVVAQAAAGLAAYVLSRAESGSPALVVGFDGRHNSAVFARDTCEIAQAMGIRALLLPEALPTPVLAFAIQHLGADAGVMVTASHNPPQDNGYKVYLGDGSQIVAPADRDIAAAIAAVGPVDALPRDTSYAVLGSEVEDAYVAAVAALAAPGARELTVAYTPMHGVGRVTAERAVEAAGFAPLHVVAEQADPDPDFPTVAFPNPEEPGATDLLLALAERTGADLAVANDPDADRCAVAVPTANGWHALTGDEVGVLLADFLLRRGVEGTYATTIVSSSLLGRLAAAYDQPYAETLTGFKWIGRVPGLAYGYEEALGYAVAPEIARDKDGISAMVRILELAAELRAEGRSLVDRLDEIAERFGLHATAQLSVRVDDLSLIGAAMTRLREAPPPRLGGFDVERVDDLERGSRTLPPTVGLRFVLAEGARVVVRPSGTEPKLKCYLEVVVPTPDGPGAARIAAAARLDAIRGDLSAALGI
ncbi:phospho-sugar mutase [Mumia sp. zg.B53]|uniref:phospho-sugar mutase n=1 Tax=unclassified Mumia TaxID=2621872 RepID=UPI001C6E364E|nr:MULTISPECIES: phospho-sugar mutase [unclassified Mumia]MBW9213779.1 phospho-sugar mutase [Mumia sp. zg.B53]MDD9347358.1 phospho-sugar mutase [Mumia sp.]